VAIRRTVTMQTIARSPTRSRTCSPGWASGASSRPHLAQLAHRRPG